MGSIMYDPFYVKTYQKSPGDEFDLFSDIHVKNPSAMLGERSSNICRDSQEMSLSWRRLSNFNSRLEQKVAEDIKR
ncbi:hypothetical protein CLOM_g20202 [Closterium sp. NIES-68]|nr:hypothetical protein CLOM_g20202 [Closterium sp. NIES-68]GJP77297.1 hypothetical protein CLOP_g7714 [Closterium sp. NIES-67]